MEINGSSATRATWNGHGPVEFPVKQVVKLLALVERMRFKDFDALGATLRGIGYLVTDLRQTIARIDDPYVAMALLADRTVEKFNDEIIILRRLPDGTHDDGIWQLDPVVFDFIRRSKLVHRSKSLRFGNFYRQVFEWGPRTFDTLSDYHKVMLGHHLLNRRRRKLREEEAAVSVSIHHPTTIPQPSVIVSPQPELKVDMRPPPLATKVGTNVVSFPRPSTKPRAAEPASLKVGDPLGASFVVAHDDDGVPITMAEVTQEYVRSVPKSMPSTSVQIPKGCSDHEVRKLTMIERIKHRRRNQKKLAGG
jgi:hypothetical protein